MRGLLNMRYRQLLSGGRVIPAARTKMHMRLESRSFTTRLAVFALVVSTAWILGAHGATGSSGSPSRIRASSCRHAVHSRGHRLSRKQISGGLYRDVPPHHWAAVAVAEISRRHILVGRRAHLFRGDAPVTRYELAEALYRMVQYLDKPNVSGSPLRKGETPIAWLVRNSYLSPDTLLQDQPSTGTVSPAVLSDALAYVTDRILLHRRS